MIEISTHKTVHITVFCEDIPPLRNVLGYCDLEEMQRDLPPGDFLEAMNTFTAIAKAVNYGEGGLNS